MDQRSGRKVITLGAGVTGLSTGYYLKSEVYEMAENPGGICASYYCDSNGKKSLLRANDETYRFELGGGHWIFGADKNILSFIDGFSKTKPYPRHSAVYFPKDDFYVPYPIQNHLSYLQKDIAQKALSEILSSEKKEVRTLEDWMYVYFGKTLCDLFFIPFHDLYTAGLYKKIAPQDAYKSPVNKDLIAKGAKEKTPAVGYNAIFYYPEKGLDDLIRNISRECNVNYGKEAVKIDVKKKEVVFKDGSCATYDKLVSTLPLNRVLQIAGIESEYPAPYSSVLVVNIGAQKGPKCPDYHWLYIPKSKSGFHRVGFYSNVDTSFIPLSSRKDNDKVSIYVEKAYPACTVLDAQALKKACDEICEELVRWKFISAPYTADPTWVEVAYTWDYPKSQWKNNSLESLKKHNIYSTGRYGKWSFQGIAESIVDGMDIKI